MTLRQTATGNWLDAMATLVNTFSLDATDFTRMRERRPNKVQHGEYKAEQRRGRGRKRKRMPDEEASKL